MSIWDENRIEESTWHDISGWKQMEGFNILYQHTGEGHESTVYMEKNREQYRAGQIMMRVYAYGAEHETVQR